MKLTISVIVPALNEENNLKAAIDTICVAMGNRFGDYEILVFDDGSTDKTGIIADEISRKDERIKVVHNGKTRGFGFNYKKGVELAKNEYIVMLPGDNEILQDSIERMFNIIGGADIIIPYTLNAYIRPLSRRIISSSFTKFMNSLFGLNLKYYNGPVIHKREIIKSVPITTSGYAYQAEILVQLIKSGYTYIQIGMEIKKREFGKSKAFSFKNIISVLKTIFRLMIKVYFKK